MPTYEYVCESCEYAFEKFQGINEEPVKECPRCGGKVRKLISGGAGLIFKGSGFYVNDYKKKEGKKEKSTSAPKKEEDKNG